MTVYVDTETYSTVDIKSAGAFKYTNNCELLLAYFLDTDSNETFLYDYSKPEEIPSWLKDHVDGHGKLRAYNATFDYLVLKAHLFPYLHITQMVDVLAKVRAHGLPGSLEKAGSALGLDEDSQKSRKGKALIKKFCIPREPTRLRPYVRVTPDMDPKAWHEFKFEYLVKDVTSMVIIDNMLPDLTVKEQQYWVDTQSINIGGIPIDLENVKLINGLIKEWEDRSATDFIRLTGVFPTQRAKVLQWCVDNGLDVKNLQKETVQKVVDSPKTPDIIRKALKIRQNISHAAFKKYPAMLNAVCEDGTLKGTLEYHAATTGRFGGRGVQPHNLVKGEIDSEEAVDKILSGVYSAELFKSAVRGMFYHEDGFTVADWSSIEARGVLWLAKDYEGLKVFKDKKDPYKVMASLIYEVDVDDVTQKQRFTGKQAVLGLGYQMWVDRFIATVEGYGETISYDEAMKAVTTYRTVHKRVVRLWAVIEDAAKMAISRPGKHIPVSNGVSFILEDKFLYMALPSTRRIAYPFAHIGDNGNIKYMTTVNNQWVESETYGGKLTENAVQGMCRDILCSAVRRFNYEPKSKEHRVVTTIHDEIVVLGDCPELKTIMETPPSWCPDFPLEVDIRHVKRFKKL